WSARWDRPDFLLPLSGEDVLADGSGRFLSAPWVLAAGQGAAGGWVIMRHFGAAIYATGAVSLFTDGMAVVCRDAGARNPTGAVRRTGDGRPFYLCAVTWGVDPRNLGCV